MKKITITLTIMLASHSGFAQMNPLIEKLISYPETRRLLEYDFDEKGICIKRGGVRYHEADFQEESNYRYWKTGEDELRDMKNVCRALSREAVESYLWESHEKGDTLMYLLTLDNPSGRETVKLVYTDRSMPFNNPEDVDGMIRELKPKGWYSFEYHLENGDKPSNHFVDTAEMDRYIEPILSRTDIGKQAIYIHLDDAYTPPAGKDWTDARMHDEGASYDSETRGVIYTIPTKAQADEVFYPLKEAINQYLKDHPHTLYGRESAPTYSRGYYNLMLSSYHEGELPHDFRILFSCPSEEDGAYHVLVLHTTGDYVLPIGWQKMKSWVNGKATYYKK